ncbi:MAG: hypothetical protein DDT29_01755 [Dehalococcoidia bacterium]|nr:hypothetical protein [Bacillota bacterium]
MPDGAVVLACQAEKHILYHFAEVEGGIGKGKELIRPLVNRLGLAHDHVVQVGSEDGQAELTSAQVVPQLDHLMPGYSIRLVSHAGPPLPTHCRCT